MTNHFYGYSKDQWISLTQEQQADIMWDEKSAAPLKAQQTTCKLRAYSMVGGYPIFYVLNHQCLCPECASEDDSGDTPIGHVNWEDSTLYCDECSQVIESAYGDDKSSQDTSFTK